jgi:hypothetical protein
MMRAVVHAGRESGLISATYLQIIEAIIPQVHKRHARQQFDQALARKKAVQVKH